MPLSISSKPTYSPTQTMETFYPTAVPTDAAIGADIAYLETVRVFQRGQFLGHGAK
jgi:hypothetical protein